MFIDYQTIDTTFEIKSLNEEGIVEGYGAVFGNVDSGGDVIKRGAFTKTLKENPKVKMLWQHNIKQPIGVWDELNEDGYGLKVRGRLNLETQQGRECFSLLKQGAIDGLSIGFVEVNAIYDNKGIRHITEAKLYEVSHVTLPMNEEAKVLVVKNNNFTPKKVVKPTDSAEMDMLVASLKRLSGDVSKEDLLESLKKFVTS